MYVRVDVCKCTLGLSENISSPIYRDSIRIIKYSGNTNKDMGHTKFRNFPKEVCNVFLNHSMNKIPFDDT